MSIPPFLKLFKLMAYEQPKIVAICSAVASNWVAWPVVMPWSVVACTFLYSSAGFLAVIRLTGGTVNRSMRSIAS
jgi:hypothetical protein